jgi:hypothetical protein
MRRVRAIIFSRLFVEGFTGEHTRHIITKLLRFYQRKKVAFAKSVRGDE